MKVFQANMLVAKFNSEIVKAPLKKQQQTFICFLFLTFLSSAAIIFLTQMWMNSYSIAENAVNLDLAASSFYGAGTAISLGWFFCVWDF